MAAPDPAFVPSNTLRQDAVWLLYWMANSRVRSSSLRCLPRDAHPREMRHTENGLLAHSDISWLFRREVYRHHRAVVLPRPGRRVRPFGPSPVCPAEFLRAAEANATLPNQWVQQG